MMQADDLKSAKLLLKDRNRLAPSDAHTFRRLALILHKEGDEKAAQYASYTAYQLGLGQHGLSSGESSV